MWQLLFFQMFVFVNETHLVLYEKNWGAYPTHSARTVSKCFFNSLGFMLSAAKGLVQKTFVASLLQRQHVWTQKTDFCIIFFCIHFLTCCFYTLTSLRCRCGGQTKQLDMSLTVLPNVKIEQLLLWLIIRFWKFQM